MRRYLLAVAGGLGLAVALPGQDVGFTAAQGLRAYFFSPQDGRPWAQASVETARREPQKLGFLRVAVLPVLVLEGGTLELDLDNFDVRTAGLWLHDLQDNPHTRGLRVAPARIILRRGGQVAWDCTAAEATLGAVDGVALRGVTLRDAAGVTRKAGAVTLVLDREAGRLRVTAPGPAGVPEERDFALTKL